MLYWPVPDPFDTLIFATVGLAEVEATAPRSVTVQVPFASRFGVTKMVLLVTSSYDHAIDPNTGNVHPALCGP